MTFSEFLLQGELRRRCRLILFFYQSQTDELLSDRWHVSYASNYLLAFLATWLISACSKVELNGKQTRGSAWKLEKLCREWGAQMELFVHDLADLLENTVCDLPNELQQAPDHLRLKCSWCSILTAVFCISEKCPPLPACCCCSFSSRPRLRRSLAANWLGAVTGLTVLVPRHQPRLYPQSTQQVWFDAER